MQVTHDVGGIYWETLQVIHVGRRAYSFSDVRQDVGLQAGVDEGLQLGGQLSVGSSVGGASHPCCCCCPGMRQMSQSCNTKGSMFTRWGLGV